MILYQEFAPHPSLLPYVACLWTCEVHAGQARHTHRVLPDNCIDILWQDRADGAFAVGMMTGAIDVITTGLVRTVAVRFKPGAAFHFFPLPLSELSDQHAPLDTLWGRASAQRILDELWAGDRSERERLDVVERHLFARLSARPPREGMLVASAIASIEGAAGRLAIDSLAQSVGVTRQHLAAQFRARVGISPKLFARLCRFRHTSDVIRALPPGQIDWSRLALDSGYFDQAHLIHEFQQFAGNTPHAFALRHAA